MMKLVNISVLKIDAERLTSASLVIPTKSLTIRNSLRWQLLRLRKVLALLSEGAKILSVSHPFKMKNMGWGYEFSTLNQVVYVVHSAVLRLKSLSIVQYIQKKGSISISSIAMRGFDSHLDTLLHIVTFRSCLDVTPHNV